MHCDAGPPHWKLIQIQKLQKACIPLDNRTDVHFILPLRGFDLLACSCMCCAKLGAARMIAKNQYRHPDIETNRQMDRLTDRRMNGQMDVQTDVRTDGHRSSTGPHWGPSDPSVGINALRLWTPILEININTKIANEFRMTRQTNVRTYYTVTQGILPHGLWLFVMHAITGRTNIRKKNTWMI